MHYQFNTPYFEFKAISSRPFIDQVNFYSKHNKVSLKVASEAIRDLIEAGKLVLIS